MPGGGSMLNAVLVFGGDASKAINAVNSLNTHLNKLDSAISGLNTKAKTVGQTGTNAFQSWLPIFKSVYTGIRSTVDGFRLMAQGIMSAGRALTFFVSIPLALFFRAGATAIIDFEDQIIRVAKTTGLTGQALENVELALRNIAKRAPTTHQELGIMAEQAGQLGISSEKNLPIFVEWMEILATSTNIAGDEVVGTMGKIAAAFKWNINESVDSVIRLSNTMNILENTTAATAGEIADALFRFAPIAAQLKIHAADAAALAATLISAGVSAESTGTRLGTMYVKLTQNADKFAEMAKNTKMYATEQDVLNAINKDAVQVLFDLIQMMGEEDNRAQALAAAFDLVNIRGGRALGNLIGSEEQLRDILKRAREEWGEAASLVMEYNRALESAKNHLQILRNNLTEVGVELGNTLLPALNDLIELLIPALRRIVQFIKALSETNKKLIIIGAVIAALIVVLGPLAFMLSQVFFGFTMVILGVLKWIAGLGYAIKLIAELIMMLVSLRVSALLVGAGFVGVAVLVLKILQNLGVDIASFFRNLARAAKTWGENLSKEIGGGIIAGAVKFIVTAITWVANLIASFLEAKSPPQMGPLSHINKWGKALIDTYFKSMKKADFSILSSISSAIEGVFRNLAKFGIIGEKEQFTYLLQAREDLAELMAYWRKTGEVSQQILDQITAHLGEAADEIQELIRLNLDLLGIEEELKRIEERREQVQEDFKNQAIEIATGPGSAEERVEAIRQAMRNRDQELRSLNEEEKELQKQKDAAQEQLDTQEAMIRAMQEQDDILARLLDAIEKLTKAAEGGYELPDIEPEDLGLPSADEILSEIGKPIIELEARIKSKGGVIDAFLAALQGKPLAAPGINMQDFFGVSDEDVDLLWDAVHYGQLIREKYLQVNETLRNFQAIISGLSFENLKKQAGGMIKDAIPPGVSKAFEKFGAWWTKNWPKIVKIIKKDWEVFSDAIKTAIEIVQPYIEPLVDAFERLAKVIKENWPQISKILGFGLMVLNEMLKFLVGWLAILIGSIVAFIVRFVTAFVNFISDLIEDGWTMGGAFQAIFKFLWEGIILNLLQFIIDFLGNVIKFFADLLGINEEKLRTWKVAIDYKLKSIAAGIGEWARGLADNFSQWIADWKVRIMSGLRTMKVAIDYKFDSIRDGITERVTEIREILTRKAAEWHTRLLEKLRTMKVAIDYKFDTIRDSITTWAEDLIENFSTWGSSFLTSLEEGIRGALQGVWDAFTELVGGIVSRFQPLIDILNTALDLIRKVTRDKVDIPDVELPGESNNDGDNVASQVGHIISQPQMRWVGEVPEAIIPLSKLPHLVAMAANRMGNLGGPQVININFVNPVVREENDFRRIAEAVERVISSKSALSVRYGGTLEF